MFYDVVPGEKPDRVLVHAYKIVNGQNEPMGDLDFGYDAGLKAWAADFSNATASAACPCFRRMLPMLASPDARNLRVAASGVESAITSSIWRVSVSAASS